MKKLFTLFLLALLPMLASADAVEIGGIYYDLESTDEAKTATVTTLFSNVEPYSGDVVIPESVTYEEVSYSVTSIGSGAFLSCSGLTSIEIPNSVTSIGGWAFSGCSGLTSITIPSSVTSIGDGAFNECSGLTSVTIPNSVTSIGEWAFYCCSGLTSIEIPNSVTSIGEWAFAGCSGLTSIAIPNSVTSISNYAFSYCSSLTLVISDIINPFRIEDNTFDFNNSNITLAVPMGGISSYQNAEGWSNFQNIVESKFTIDGISYIINGPATVEISSAERSLTSVVIPNSVAFNGTSYSITSIRDRAFSDCSSLTSITIPDGVTSIGSSTFSRCSSLTSITIPNSVMSIGDWGFFGCSGLTSITIPDGVTSIGEYAFSGCSGLTSSITIPNGVTSIERNAFSGCSGLPYVTIPNSVTSIGSSAFSGCSGLTSVTIPNSVTSIGSSAFSGCSGLTSIIVDAGNTVYDSRKGCNAIIRSDDNVLIAGCMNTRIPNDVTSIGGGAFSGCSGLISIEIPNSVTSIGSYAFSDCNNLSSITIPDSITSINDAFAGCSGLTTLIIHNSVTSIEDLVFDNCKKLTDIYCFAEKVPETGPNSFEESVIKHVTLHVPAGSIADYMATEPWSNSKEIVEIKEGEPNTFIAIGTPLTLEAISETLTVTISTYNKGPINIQYSVDGGEWKDIEIPNDGHRTIPESGKIIQLRSNYKWGYATILGSPSMLNHTSIICDTDCYIYGNLMSLIAGENFSTHYDKVVGNFGPLFRYETHLRNHPDKKLVLPATNLTVGCYRGLFMGCTGLTEAPELPATILNDQCYRDMFNGCTGLTKAPELPADVLDKECYSGMFSGCTALTEAPQLPSVALSSECYKDMFSGCTSLTTAPALPSTKLSDYCYSGMFSGCTSLKKAPELPATTLKKECYAHMFEGCTSLTESPVLPATILLDGCYNSMFKGCTNLNTITCEATSVSDTDEGAGDFAAVTKDWVDGVSETGTFFKAPSMTSWPSGADGIPVGWNVVDITEPECDVITLKDTGKGTYCSEYDLDFTDVEGIKAYVAIGYDDISKTIWLARIYAVPAGTGIMVKGDPGEHKIPHAAVRSVYTNYFKGNTGSKITIYETDGDMTNYYMSNGQFVSVNGTANIAANRCYLQLPTSVFAGTRSIGIVYDDEEEGTTGINSMDNGQWIMDKGSDAFYNLQGQRVENPRKGIYIKNGRKVVVK